MTSRFLPGLLVLYACTHGTAPPSQPPMPPLDRSTPPTVPPLPDYHAEPVEQHVLRNGLRVWLVERASAVLVEARLVIDAGVTREPAHQSGLASLTAALLSEGSVNYSAAELADQVDLLGAELRTGAGRDGAVVSLSTLPRNTARAFAILGDVVQNPTFSAAAFEQVRRQRLNEILAAASQPAVLANQQFAAVVYGRNHAYGRPVRGTRSSLGRLTNQDVGAFYREYYHPANAVLVVTGAVHATTLLPLLERVFHTWNPADVPPVPAVHSRIENGDGAIHLVDRPGSAQSELRVGYPVVPRGDPTFAGLTVANTVLGDIAGRIWQNLRE